MAPFVQAFPTAEGRQDAHTANEQDAGQADEVGDAFHGCQFQRGFCGPRVWAFS